MNALLDLDASLLDTPYQLYEVFREALPAGALNASSGSLPAGVRTLKRRTRTVTDTNGQASIAGGELVIAGAALASANPWVRSSATLTRVAGQLVAMRFKVATGKMMSYLGLVTEAAAPGPALFKAGADETYWSLQWGGGVSTARQMYLYEGCWYEVIFQLRASGCAFYINDGSGARLVWVSDAQSDAALGLAYRSGNTHDQDVRTTLWNAPEKLQPLTAVFSDAFGRADGALGVTDGAGHAEANSGAGYAWTDSVGTWAIASGAAGCPTLASGVGIATVDAGTTDGILRGKATRAGGNVGLVARYVDSNNHYRIYHDGTNLKLDKVVGGVVSTLMTPLSVAYSASKVIWAKFDGVHARIGYGDTATSDAYGIDLVLITDPLAGTRWGLYTTNAGNTLDDVALHPLQPPLVRANPLTYKTVYCGFDSLSARPSGYQETLRKLLGDGWATVPRGASGYTAVSALARFPELVLSQRVNYVVILAGINDINAGATAAALEANLQAMYTAASAAGIKVVAVTIGPWKGHAQWTSDKQVVQDAVNAWIGAKPAGVDYVVDDFAAAEDPGAADTLLAAYDSGDHLHRSTAGYAALGTTIYNGVAWA